MINTFYVIDIYRDKPCTQELDGMCMPLLLKNTFMKIEYMLNIKKLSKISENGYHAD